MGRRLVAVALIVVCLTAAGPARAASFLSDDAAASVTLFAAPTIGFVGLATVIGNIRTIVSGERHGDGLALASLIVAGLELGVAGICLHYAGTDFDHDAPGLWRNVAIISAAWGLINAGLGIWAWTRPLARSKLSLAPLPLIAADGSWVPGLALRVATF